MERGIETPRRRGGRAVLGIILIVVGLMAIFGNLVVLGFAPARHSFGRTIAHEVVIVPPRPPAELSMAEAERQMEFAAGEMQREMAMAEIEMERAAAEMQREMARAEREMELAARHIEVARPRPFFLAPFFGGFGLIAGLFRLGLTLATFGLLGLGAYFVVRELGRNRRQSVPATPTTGPEADRARDA